MMRVDAGKIAEEITRQIERTWHSSRPKPRPKAMGMERDETNHERRMREARQILLEDEALRDRVYRMTKGEQ